MMRLEEVSVLFCYVATIVTTWSEVLRRPDSLQQYRTWTAAQAAGILIMHKWPVWVLHHTQEHNTAISNDTSQLKLVFSRLQRRLSFSF